MVARMWADLIAVNGARFRTLFDRIVFAIWGDDTFRQFKQAFEERTITDEGDEVDQVDHTLVVDEWIHLLDVLRLSCGMYILFKTRCSCLQLLGLTCQERQLRGLLYRPATLVIALTTSCIVSDNRQVHDGPPAHTTSGLLLPL